LISRVNPPEDRARIARHFTSVKAIEDAIGESMGPTDWLTIAQSRIDSFAEASGDDQWIHVDPERARRGPFGAAIAHGYLLLSLIPLFTSQLYTANTGSLRLNYGLNRVRFPGVARVEDRIRARAVFEALRPHPLGLLLSTTYTIEAEGSDTPACVAEGVSLLVT
jgi:acyl dehydratase